MTTRYTYLAPDTQRAAAMELEGGAGIEVRRISLMARPPSNSRPLEGGLVLLAT